MSGHVSKKPNGRWQARHRPVPGGPQVVRTFPRKVDATRWLDEQQAAIVTGQYVDPRAGQVTFRDYAEQWRLMQAHRPSSRAHVETMLRRHAYPTLGVRPLAAILPSEVQAWATGLTLAPATIGVVHGLVSSVFKAAVRDRRVVANPCEGTKLPRVERARVVPPTTEQVVMLEQLLPAHLRAVVPFVAGTGLRQGEVFGLTLDRLPLLRREVVVDRQLVIAGGEVELGPVKTAASNRVIPLAGVVVDVAAAHLAEHGTGDHGLVFTLEDGSPVTRSVFGHLWRPVAAEVGLEPGQGLHALRHYFASLLIRHGESVKTVQARLGHASAVETLDTYSHLWPDHDDRTREAVQSVLGGEVPSSDRHQHGQETS